MGLIKLVDWRPCILILSSLFLASCATKDPSSLAYGKRDIGIDDAFVLPADRSVVGITQERASNAMTQTIFLSTNSALSGENFFRATFYGPVNSAGATERTLPYAALTDGRISRELRTEMAGIAMNRTPYYVQNNYGPFSYATGRAANGESCIYAWQQIRSPEHTKNFFQNRGRIDLRLRLCETGTSQEKLLASMYEFTINATIAAHGWNPYGEPASPSPKLGRPGNPLLAPSVNSHLSGPFPASDLNTNRLNTTVEKTERKPAVNRAAPALTRAPTKKMQPAPENYGPVAQPYRVNPYAGMPVTVPAPQQVKMNAQQPFAMPPDPAVQPRPQVPSPAVSPSAIAPRLVPSQVQVVNAPAIIVPSPCRPATQQSSGTIAGNSNMVCP